MVDYPVSVSALISAPVDKVYAIIADYQKGHSLILPKPYFVSMVVEEGGVGAGTRIRFQMALMGRLQTFRAVITEPEPGRVLVETDLDAGTITTFTVEPKDNGKTSFVTIETILKLPNGIAGKIQGWLAARMLRPIYVKELAQLAIVANGQP